MYKLQDGEFWCWIPPMTLAKPTSKPYENTPLVGRQLYQPVDGRGGLMSVRRLLADGTVEHRDLLVYCDMINKMDEFMLLCLLKSDRLEVRDA